MAIFMKLRLPFLLTVGSIYHHYHIAVIACMVAAIRHCWSARPGNWDQQNIRLHSGLEVFCTNNRN